MVMTCVGWVCPFQGWCKIICCIYSCIEVDNFDPMANLTYQWFYGMLMLCQNIGHFAKYYNVTLRMILLVL
jgi:hypothetical protein